MARTPGRDAVVSAWNALHRIFTSGLGGYGGMIGAINSLSARIRRH